MQKLKVNDNVVVLAGKDKGKQGKIKNINWKTNRVVVEGVNVVKKTMKPNQQNPQGGLVDIEKALHVSNVAVTDPKSGKATRVKVTEKNGKKIRVAKSGADIK
ncbi:MAG: 50S ribosomal protein L24 [Bacteriovoracaceae bacterium]|nr:50S ribosomal protein L24 [Bacteriovoracaceae bacterium]